MTVPYDLLDFLLGAGWIGLLIVLFVFIRRKDEGGRMKDESQILNHNSSSSFILHPSSLPLILLCIAQPVFVALTGLVQTETARVWMFMLPLWAVPIGLELETWRTRLSVIAFVALWLLTASIGQNMILISPELSASPR
jgi:hypothetical protein